MRTATAVKLGFRRSADFLTEASTLDKGVPVYVDRHLGNGDSGDLLVSELYRQGLRRVFLATGDSPSTIPAEIASLCAGVVGKEPRV